MSKQSTEVNYHDKAPNQVLMENAFKLELQDLTEEYNRASATITKEKRFDIHNM